MSDVMQSSVNRSLRRIEIPAASPRRAQPESFRGLQIPWPDGLAPKPVAIDPAPSPDDPLPRVDVIAMVDTVAEAEATSDVLTPGVYYTGWYRYARNFATVFQPQLGPNAPADREPYLGLYYLMELAGLRVLVYKTNLHMHTDGKKLPDGSYTLPIRDMLAQMIADAKPKFFLTTGTSGGVYCSMQLGDVAITRAATFLCKQHYADAPFAGKTYRSAEWDVPRKYADTARSLMQAFAGKLTGAGTPPDPACSCNASTAYPTDLYFDGVGKIPAWHPVITTDFFEFGTSTNRLDETGVAVEMDDAVLGLVCSELEDPPYWASIRNLSDPCINGALPEKTQGDCAGFYYEKYGYWTTVSSALATWSVIAGLGG